MPSTPASTHRSRWPLIVLCLLFGTLVWPPILFGHQAVSEADDQNNYHLPVIQKMAQQWPHVDLVNYESATAPGYHLGMALIDRFVSDDARVLRFVSSLFGFGLVISVYWFAALRVGACQALAVAAPLCCSSYVLSGSMWLTTDNAAWLFAALALGSATLIPTTPGRIISASVFTTVAVFVRQIHIWLIAPIGLAGLLRIRESSSGRPQVIAALLTIILPITLLLWLVLTWHGLVPPGSAEVNRLHGRGMNPTVVPLTLALFGAFGVFFLGSIGRAEVRSIWGDWRTWLILFVATIVSLAFPTSHSFVQEDGRWGGLIWEVIRRLRDRVEYSVVLDRSLIITPLVLMGALVLWIGWRRTATAGNARFASLLLFGVLCWLAAQSMNTQVWQRYLEPMVLITLPWLASLASSPTTDQPSSLRVWIGPTILAALLLLLSLKTVYLPVFTGATPT